MEAWTLLSTQAFALRSRRHYEPIRARCVLSRLNTNRSLLSSHDTGMLMDVYDAYVAGRVDSASRSASSPFAS